jgi:hypothetical protein
MPTFSCEPDVVFYNLIHQLVEAPPRDEAADRRQCMRQAFLAWQRIAPGYGDETPPESAYVEVQCHDLSCNGFSFFLPNPPEFDRLVAMLGRPPSLICVAARVSHCTEVLVYPSKVVEQRGDRTGHLDHQASDAQTGMPMVLVGCRFVRKLAPVTLREKLLQ